MSKSKAVQTEQPKGPTLDDVQGWVDKARNLVNGLEQPPVVVFAYGGSAQYGEDMPFTFKFITDVTYSVSRNELTFVISE